MSIALEDEPTFNNLSTESTEVGATQETEHEFMLSSTEDNLTKADAKTEQITELSEKVQQPFQLTADVDNFGDELALRLFTARHCGALRLIHLQ